MGRNGHRQSAAVAVTIKVVASTGAALRVNRNEHFVYKLMANGKSGI
jgi:hypothetical protein